jgi:hypothetical protein
MYFCSTLNEFPLVSHQTIHNASVTNFPRITPLNTHAFPISQQRASKNNLAFPSQPSAPDIAAAASSYTYYAHAGWPLVN